MHDSHLMDDSALSNPIAVRFRPHVFDQFVIPETSLAYGSFALSLLFWESELMQLCGADARNFGSCVGGR